MLRERALGRTFTHVNSPLSDTPPAMPAASGGYPAAEDRRLKNGRLTDHRRVNDDDGDGWNSIRRLSRTSSGMSPVAAPSPVRCSELCSELCSALAGGPRWARVGGCCISRTWGELDEGRRCLRSWWPPHREVATPANSGVPSLLTSSSSLTPPACAH